MRSRIVPAGAAPPLSAVHAIAAWFVILLGAIANGGFREAVLIPRLGRALGTSVSGVLLIAAVFIVARVMQRWRSPTGTRQAWQIGMSWFVATVLFELVFGFIQGKGGPELLSAYTFSDGNLWPLVLLALAVSPYLCSRFGRTAGR